MLRGLQILSTSLRPCFHFFWTCQKVCYAKLFLTWFFMFYSTRNKELGNWREAKSGRQLGFIIKFFTTKCTFRCTMLLKVLEPFQWNYFIFCKKIFFSFLPMPMPKDYTQKILIYMLVRHICTNFFFGWGFSTYFCGYGTKNLKNTKIGISAQVVYKISWFLVWY